MTRNASFLILFMFVSLFQLNAQKGSKWNNKNAESWFEKKEWIPAPKPSESVVTYDGFGRIIETVSPDTNIVAGSHIELRKLTPHNSIDKVEFAKQYHAHKT